MRLDDVDPGERMDLVPESHQSLKIAQWKHGVYFVEGMPSKRLRRSCTVRHSASRVTEGRMPFARSTTSTKLTWVKESHPGSAESSSWPCRVPGLTSTIFSNCAINSMR